MIPPMQTSDGGLQLIEMQEGCELVAYQDTGGIWTDGYGNTNGVVPGSTITREKAEADLRENVASSERAVCHLVTVPLTQDQFDALVDFVFNLGAGNLGGSTLLRLLNAGDYEGAAGQFSRWIHDSAGHELQDLVNRRAAEAVMFLNGYANPPAPAKPH